MTDSSTKHFWILDLKYYQPVLVTVDGDVDMEAGFSLLEEMADSGDRLKSLMDFIRDARRSLTARGPELTSLTPFGVSHQVVEQIVFLAYWRNYRLEFHINKAGDDYVVSACFPNKPELNCLLDQFTNGFDPCNELQRWFDFFCAIIKEHAEIWQIHLIMDECACEKLAMPGNAAVFLEIQDSESTLISDRTAAALSPSPSERNI